VRLVDCQQVNWKDHADFFAISAQMMCRVLVEFARSQLVLSNAEAFTNIRSPEVKEFRMSREAALENSPGRKLINGRLAYVAVSRARYDAKIYTNDAGNLGRALSREASHTAAFECNGFGKPDGDQENHGEEEKDHGHDHAERSLQI